MTLHKTMDETTDADGNTIEVGDIVTIADSEHAYRGREIEVTEIYKLLDKIVVDGFKADGGDYMPQMTVKTNQLRKGRDADLL